MGVIREKVINFAFQSTAGRKALIHGSPAGRTLKNDY